MKQEAGRASVERGCLGFQGNDFGRFGVGGVVARSGGLLARFDHILVDPPLAGARGYETSLA